MKIPRRLGLLAVVLVSTLTLSGCVTPPSKVATGPGSIGSSSCTAVGTIPQIPGMSADRQAAAEKNAQAIAAAAAELGLPVKATQIAMVVALTESTLENIGFGDVQNGVMTTSRGLFQQIKAWILDGVTPDPRLDPKAAAKMFFTGGARGQEGLTDIAGWENMDIPTAAQRVEKSQFTDGSNYAKNLTLGVAIANAVTGTAPTCSTSSNVAVNGVQVTIPDNEFVIAQARGKTIVAPSAEMAKGLAAGFAQLGLPYVWGGGNAAGGGPDNGCARGGGAKNSCGAAIGFDCSGLTAFVLGAGNPAWKPGTQSSIQRAGGIPVAYASGLPGDIVGFPGHVAIFLGVIDGVQYILEASDVGIPIHVVQLRRTDRDANLHRYWTASPA